MSSALARVGIDMFKALDIPSATTAMKSVVEKEALKSYI